MSATPEPEPLSDAEFLRAFGLSSSREAATVEEEFEKQPPESPGERNDRIQAFHRSPRKSIGTVEAIHSLWQDTKYAAESGFEVAAAPADALLSLIKGEGTKSAVKRLKRWKQLRAVYDHWALFGFQPIQVTAGRFISDPDHYIENSIIPDEDDVPLELRDMPPLLTADEALFQSTHSALGVATAAAGVSSGLRDLIMNETIHLTDQLNRNPETGVVGSRPASSITMGEVLTSFTERQMKAWINFTNPIVDWRTSQIEKLPPEAQRRLTGTTDVEKIRAQSRRDIQYGVLNPVIWAGTAATTSVDIEADPLLVLDFLAIGKVSKGARLLTQKVGSPLANLARERMLFSRVPDEAAAAWRKIQDIKKKTPLSTNLSDDELKTIQTLRLFLDTYEDASGLHPEQFRSILDKKAKKVDPKILSIKEDPVAPRTVVDSYIPPPATMTGEALQPDMQLKIKKGQRDKGIGAARPGEFMTLEESRMARMEDLSKKFLRSEQLISEGENVLYHHSSALNFGEIADSFVIKGSPGPKRKQGRVFFTRQDAAKLRIQGQQGLTNFRESFGPIRFVTTREELGRQGVRTQGANFLRERFEAEEIALPRRKEKTLPRRKEGEIPPRLDSPRDKEIAAAEATLFTGMRRIEKKFLEETKELTRGGELPSLFEANLAADIEAPIHKRMNVSDAREELAKLKEEILESRKLFSKKKESLLREVDALRRAAGDVEISEVPLSTILKVEIDPAALAGSGTMFNEAVLKAEGFRPSFVQTKEAVPTKGLSPREQGIMEVVRKLEANGIPVVIKPLFMQTGVEEFRPFIPKKRGLEGPGASGGEDIFRQKVSKRPLSDIEITEMRRRISFSKQLERQGRLTDDERAQVKLFKDALAKMKEKGKKKNVGREDLITIRENLSRGRLGQDPLEGPGAAAKGEIPEAEGTTTRSQRLFPESQKSARRASGQIPDELMFEEGVLGSEGLFDPLNSLLIAGEVRSGSKKLPKTVTDVDIETALAQVGGGKKEKVKTIEEALAGQTGEEFVDAKALFDQTDAAMDEVISLSLPPPGEFNPLTFQTAVNRARRLIKKAKKTEGLIWYGDLQEKVLEDRIKLFKRQQGGPQ